MKITVEIKINKTQSESIIKIKATLNGSTNKWD